MGPSLIRPTLMGSWSGQRKPPPQQFQKILLPLTAAMASRGTGGISM